jgi:hypothetical protein
MPWDTCLTKRFLLSYILYFFWIRRLNLEKCYESIVKIFLGSLKLKRWLSDLISVILIKKILKRCHLGISLTLFRIDWTNYEKRTFWILILVFFKLSKHEKPPSLPLFLSLYFKALKYTVKASDTSKES